MLSTTMRSAEGISEDLTNAIRFLPDLHLQLMEAGRAEQRNRGVYTESADYRF